MLQASLTSIAALCLNLPHVSKDVSRIFSDHERIVHDLSIEITLLVASLNPTVSGSNSKLTVNDHGTLKFQAQVAMSQSVELMVSAELMVCAELMVHAVLTVHAELMASVELILSEWV